MSSLSAHRWGRASPISPSSQSCLSAAARVDDLLNNIVLMLYVPAANATRHEEHIDDRGYQRNERPGKDDVDREWTYLRM